MPNKKCRVKLVAVFLALSLVWVSVTPSKSYAAVDSMENRTVVHLLEKKGEQEQGAKDTEESLKNIVSHYPKTSEVRSFVLSLVGTLSLFGTFFIWLLRRRRKDEEV
ncbi:LPXTG cell wall anchor domain-containing protein [Enterococcus sp. AD013-P3]|uniref:LPXTG cell wall anchor domain-containing protein n=1 Tax=Enterococcus sp. AD013-P3 TaxID=3411036 RepID=UPI003B94E6E8